MDLAVSLMFGPANPNALSFLDLTLYLANSFAPPFASVDGLARIMYLYLKWVVLE